MTAGHIVVVDWREAVHAGEPNKRRPAIVVGAPPYFPEELPFEIVVPITGEAELFVPGVSITIEPTPENGCTKRSFALSWNVQCVPHARITATASRVTDDQLALIRAQIRACVAA